MLIAKIIVVIPSVLMALFLKCFGLPAKTKNKNKPDYCVKDIFLGTFVDLVSRIAEVTC